MLCKCSMKLVRTNALLDPDDPTTPDIVNAKRNWIQSIVHCQKWMREDMGQGFLTYPCSSQVQQTQDFCGHYVGC